MRRLALITLLVGVAASALAQRTVPTSPHFARAFSHRNLTAFFADPFYSDALYTTGYPVASQPPIIMQAAPSNATPEPQPAQPAQPLLIELQGDHYVRVTGEAPSGSQMIDQQPSAPRRLESPSSAPQPTAQTPVILVFRDGHREEVSDYTIANGILYARADFYTDGSWNKQIQLNSLNLPETLKANQSRAIKFRLPIAPNEVIVGP